MNRPRALVVSPTPTHPADHGNRNRVHQMTAALARQGLAVDFVLYPIDNDWQGAVPPAMADMQREWESVTVVAPSRPLHAPPVGLDHRIDEWWDPALELQVAWLLARRRYQVMLVNYAFLSRALTLAPPGCVRVLDTHDRLAGRRALFERHGQTPEFFHTTEAEERVALARADIVVAIKEGEAAAFRAITDRPVVAVSFLPPRTRAVVPTRADTLRVGFIGADNKVNAANLARFLPRLALHRKLFLPDLEMVVAGRVCRRLPPEPGVTLLGHLDDVATFYRAVDVVVAPLDFSTGLKVKVAEALAWGCPVVATANAFDGFAPADPFHSLPDIDAVCAALMELAADRRRLEVLRLASVRAATAARVAVAGGLANLGRAIAAHRHCIVVVTDVAWWRRGSVMEERSHQAIAFLADASPVVVIAATALVPDGAAPGIEVRAVGPLAGARLRRRVVRELARLAADRTVLICWQSLTYQTEPIAVAVPVIVDCWPYVARHPGLDHGAAAADAHDLVLPPATRRLAALPLRHLPGRVPWTQAGPPPARPLLILLETAADGLDPLRARLAAVFQRSGGARRVAVLRSSDLACDPDLFDRLAALPAPVAIVTIEMAALGREVADSLGRACGAALFHLAMDLYPQLGPPACDEAIGSGIGGETGGALVTDAWQHAARIVEWLPAAPATAASEVSADAGWSVVWRVLQTRAREARMISPAPAPVIRCDTVELDLLSVA